MDSWMDGNRIKEEYGIKEDERIMRSMEKKGVNRMRWFRTRL